MPSRRAQLQRHTNQSCPLIVALITMYFLTASLISYIFVRPIYSTNTGAPACPPRLLKTRCTGQGEEDRDREIDKYCLNAPCLLLECCLEYLSSRISIPRCSINFHTAQLINNINKYLKRAISRFSRSLQPLIFCKTQCIKDSEVDIFFKIISCVVISTSIC